MPFEDLEIIHPDCYFRIKKEGGFFTFYVSNDGDLWEKVTHSIMPSSEVFDLTIPVTLPDNTAKPFVLYEETDEEEIE